MPLTTNSYHERITAIELMTFDDIVTDTLVDCVHYWTKIRKNRSSYTPRPRISSHIVTSILQDAVRHTHQETGVSKAVSQLIDIPNLQEFYRSLQPKKAEDFRKHLRMYVDIYMPDCPFEVLSTNRYTKSMHEATVAARRLIRKGEVIKYLRGTRVRLTPKEKAELGDHFSIVEQTRNKATSLFLGPARFSNHDCAANAGLMPIGRTSMEVRANRDILIGEEILVSYGDHYFDEGNHNCLCRTCEDAQQKGWQQYRDSSARSSGNYTQTIQFDSHKACGTCHWLFPLDNPNLRPLGCPKCKRHTNLYGLQWPHRRGNRYIHPEVQMAPCHKEKKLFKWTDTPSHNRKVDCRLLSKPSPDYDVVDDDYFPTLNELICSTLRKHGRMRKPEGPKHACHKVDKRYHHRRSIPTDVVQSKSTNLGNSPDTPIFIEDDGG